jgi:hypothetical protein
MTTEKMKVILEEQIELLSNLNKTLIQKEVNTGQISQNVQTIMDAIKFSQCM